MNAGELIEELCDTPDEEILDIYGPCQGSLEILDLVKKLRELNASAKDFAGEQS